MTAVTPASEEGQQPANEATIISNNEPGAVTREKEGQHSALDDITPQPPNDDSGAPDRTPGGKQKEWQTKGVSKKGGGKQKGWQKKGGGKQKGFLGGGQELRKDDEQVSSTSAPNKSRRSRVSPCFELFGRNKQNDK